MKIYQSVEAFMESPYLDLLTLVNAVRYVAMKDQSILLYDNKNMTDVFNEYLEILVKYDFFDEEKKLETVVYVEQEINHFFEKQDLVSKYKFDEMYELNREFISIYWNDLFVFKRYDVVLDIFQNFAKKYHNDMIGDEVLKKGFSVSQDYTDIHIYSIFREDKSTMTICTIILEEEDKKELIDFYRNNNKIEECKDYEAYLREQLSA